MKSTSASGATIRFSDWGGDDSALLLLPGWCVDRTVFDDITPLLAKNHRVLSLDWRSHGDSERPEDDFDGYELVEDALAVIESSCADTIVPVALSHAGWIAIALRRRLGNRIRKLVLLDWMVTDPPQRSMRYCVACRRRTGSSTATASSTCGAAACKTNRSKASSAKS